MRKATDHGPCADCGRDAPGLYWKSIYHVHDFGVATMPPLEPDDMGEPVRCDRCEQKHKIAQESHAEN